MTSAGDAEYEYLAAERAAIIADSAGGPIDILSIRREDFFSEPQTGRNASTTWDALARALAKPVIAQTKDAVGGWVPGLFRDGVRRKTHLIHACAMTIDVDENGDVDRIANELAGRRAIVHSTFSSTASEPRCRVVLDLLEPLTAEEYDRAHAFVRERLAASGIVADEGAKDVSRLNFRPVVRTPGEYRFRSLRGRCLDARSILAAIPPEPVRAPYVPANDQHGDRYISAALRRAGEAVAAATPGSRHYVVGKEAFRLARPELKLNEGAIVDALLPAFVAAAGTKRAAEGKRTILDAVEARRRS